MPEPEAALSCMSHRQLVDETVDQRGIGWSEVFRANWADPERKRWVVAMATDMLTRGAAIPIPIERTGQTMRVTDGHLRVHAAWILRLDEVPIHITKVSE